MNEQSFTSNQTNAQQPAPQTVKSKPQKTTVSPLVVVLAIAVLGLAGYICYDKFFATTSTNTAQVENCQDTTETVSADELDPNITEISDVESERTISSLASKILSFGSNDSSSQSLITGGDDTDTVGEKFASDTFKNLSDGAKLYSVLQSHVDKELIWNAQKEKFLMKNTDTIKAEYKKLYGTEISYPNSAFGCCPAYTYNKAEDTFYADAGCGGGGYSTGYIYKYKFAKSDDAAYVYFAVGGQEFSEDEVSGDIYYDFLDEPTANTAPSNKTKLQGIDANNYQDFAHYRLVFSIAPDGSFIYQTIESVND